MAFFNGLNTALLDRLNSFSTSGFVANLAGSAGNFVSDSFGLGGTQLGNVIGGSIANVATGQIQQLANSVDPGLFSKIDSGLKVAGDVLNGNLAGAGFDLLNSNLLDGVLPDNINSLIRQQIFWNTPTKLCGGLSPAEWYQTYQEHQLIDYANKQLFVIEVYSNLQGDASKLFNMLAIDLEYSPQTVNGDKIEIGSGFIDAVKSSAATELSLTTFDTKDGFIKQFFKNHYAATVQEDGTVGVPIEYAIKFVITHSVAKKDFYFTNDYQDSGWFRVANMPISFSKRDPALTELQLSFTQLDSFMWSCDKR